MKFLIIFFMIFNQCKTVLFTLHKDFVFENSYKTAIKKARKLDQNILILAGRDIKENLINNFLDSFENYEVLQKVSRKNVFLVIDKDNEIFNKINLLKSPTIFLVDAKNEQIKVVYVGSIQNSVKFDKEFLNYILETESVNSMKIQKVQEKKDKINTHAEKVFYMALKEGNWLLKLNGQEKKLIPFNTNLKEFLVFKEVDENKLYAVPKSKVGNIYFSLVNDNAEEWKIFGEIK